MGLEQVFGEDEVLALYNESPSHAVGLEHMLYLSNAFSLGMLSSSHTVGLEQKRKLCFYFCMLRNSRHPTQWAWNKKSYTLS